MCPVPTEAEEVLNSLGLEYTLQYLHKDIFGWLLRDRILLSQADLKLSNDVGPVNAGNRI